MRTLLLVLATSGLLALQASPGLASPDRRSGLERGSGVGTVRAKVPQVKKPVRGFTGWQSSFKRCPECRRTDRLVGGAGGVPGPGPSVPEPSGALLFAIGALALRSRLGARGARR